MRRAILAAALAALLTPTAALGAFPQDPPNDPRYDRAEENCAEFNINEQQYYLYNRPSNCTPQAKVLDGAAGMSVDAAWKRFTTGRSDVVIAYVEGGPNWADPLAKDLVNKIFVNDGELPPPTTPKDDGRLNIEDFADTPDHNKNGYPDPEDLIVRYTDGKDDDGNGYPDDISGWDFYDDQNDPATYDSEQLHANNQMRQTGGEGDNGIAGIGMCPSCMIVPVKAGAEALDRTDDLAQAWLYAADIGASVIASVTADLGYSSFMRDAVEDVWRRGVVMVAASNDFDSTDHQGGHFHPHVIPGNGMTTDSNGVPGPGANALTTTTYARSGQTSWGTKNFLTVSTQGGSTSTSVPTHAGLYALLLSAGRNASDAGRLRGGRLTAAEVLQVARATATDINDPSTNWPSKPGWDLQFGYGRPHALRAMEAIDAGNVPPVGWMTSPDWYALLDPTVTKSVEVRGHVEAKRSSSYRWELQVAPGAEPTEAQWRSAGSGSGAAPFDGKLGTVDLTAVPESFWSAAFSLSKTKTLETNEQYTVSLRLRVTDAEGRVGEDRRSIAVHRDTTARAGFPKRIGREGTGGEAQPQLVDLQGRGRLAAVFGDTDGVVHAIDGVTGKELPGWPVITDPTRVQRKHPGVDPGHEPVIANAAVGDLDGTGALSVVVTSSTGRVYVFDERGKRRRGWPKALDADIQKPAVPRVRKPFFRAPALGAFAPPVLVDLDGAAGLEVVQAGWDGHLHAWRANGTIAPGRWPVRVEVSAPAPAGFFRLADMKLDSPPAVADLDGDGKPELVVRSQQFDIIGEGIQPAGRGWNFAFHADGRPVADWPIRQQALIVYFGSAQEFITEGANIPSAADVDGDGRDEVTVSPIFSGTTAYGASGKEEQLYGNVPDTAFSAVLRDPASLLSGNLPTDVPVSFTTSGAFGRFGGALTFAEPASGAASTAGALLTTGTGLPINNVVRAHRASGGANVSGFPAASQGLNFLGAPVFADVTGDGEAELLQGGDSSALHAYAQNGSQAPAFPKFHTGWSLYAPTAADSDGDGRTEIWLRTREGYLMAWDTKGRADANGEWWAFRHDERNTSRHGVDARPPSVVRSLRLRGREVTWRAPGDDWLAGRVERYVIRAFDTRAAGAAPRSTRELRADAAPGDAVSATVPEGTRRVEVQAVDDAANLGRRVSVPRPVTLKCVSRRRFTIRLPRVRGIVRAEVHVGGKRVRVRKRGSRRVATVDLRGRPAGTVVVRISQRRAGGKTVRTVRAFRTCAARRR